MNIVSIVIVLLIASSVATNGYHLGGDETMCWRKIMSSGAQVLLDACPDEISAEWIERPPIQFLAGHETPSVRWRVSVDLDIVDSNGVATNETPHSNIHACIADVYPFCTPNVKETPGLVSHTDAQTGVFDVDGEIEFEAPLLVGVVATNQSCSTHATSWKLIAHTRVFQLDADDGLVQWDFAIGTTTTVEEAPTQIFISDGVRIALYVIAGLALLVVAVCLALLFVYREHAVVRCSSALFLFLMCGFAMLGISAVYFLGLREPESYSCIVSVWFGGIAFAGIFGCLLAKTWRLYRLFSSKSFSVLVVSNLQVLAVVGAIVAGEALILLLWSTIDAPEPIADNEDDDSGEFSMRCESDHDTIWIAVLSVYQFAVLIVGAVLAYLTRHLTTLFRESTYIGYSIVVMFIIAIIVPIQYALKASPDAVFVLQSIAVLMFAVVVLLICLPKFIRVFRGDNAGGISSGTRLSASRNGASLGSSEMTASDSSAGGLALSPRVAVKHDGSLRGRVAESMRRVSTLGTDILRSHDARDGVSKDQMSAFVGALDKLNGHLSAI
jgi:7 transmembrane sweet-taste receptor of 3 GCPR